MKLSRFMVRPFNKFKYWQKFLLIGLLFTLPLAVILYLWLTELSTRIDNYGWQEIHGTEYLRSLRNLLQHTQQHQYLVYNYALTQDNTLKNELASLQTRIDEDFQALTTVDQKYGLDFKSTESVTALKEEWRELKNAGLKLNAANSYAQHAGFIANIRSLISLVGNTSFLILDPDLDSYYMMDVVLLKLPETQDLLAQTRIFYPGNDTGLTLTPDEKGQLIALTSRLNTDLEATHKSLHTAFEHNSSGNLKPQLEEPFHKYELALEKYLELLQTKIINSPTVAVEFTEFEAVSSQALEASYQFYDVASPGLESILRLRVESLTNRQYLLAAFSLSIIIVAFFVGLVLLRAISRPLEQLVAASKQVAAGDMSVRLYTDSEDEVRQVMVAFNDMAEALQTSQTQTAAFTSRLQLVGRLSEHLSSLLKLDQLLDEVVNQVKERFNFYHVHIYLLDDKREKLVVAAGTGSAGAEMKALGHNILLDAPRSLVAQAARSGQVVLVDNVREAEGWLPNLLLPNTYSEMAVPITLGQEGQVVGVLDVQEDTIAAFNEGDADLLQALANQVAVAIHNARQFAQVESALAQARATQQQYIEQAWGQDRVKGAEYLYQQAGAPELSDAIYMNSKTQALAQNRPVVISIDDGENVSESLVAPVIVGGKTIGALQLHNMNPPQKGQTWDEQDLALVEAILDQIAQTAESLRLFEETRERAGYEQTVREITNKLRAATNLDRLLETAARELGQRLGVRHTVLELGLKTEPLASNAKNGQGSGSGEVL